MATHTNTGGEAGKRRFQIGRENGEKTGKPVFLEWLRELPAEADRKGRIFETRTGSIGPRHYERFSAIDGVITDIRKESRVIMDEEKTFLYLTMGDGDEVYDVEIGDFDGRYSLNLMSRLCSPDFNPTLKARLSPYALEAEGKMYIGVSLYNGPDKIEARREGDGFQPAKAETSEFKGKKLWDFLPVANWLFDYLQKNVVPSLPGNAWETAPATAAASTRPPSNATEVPFPETEPAGIGKDDDLPF